MKKFNRSTAIQLFLCVVLLLVVISCSLFSSLKTVMAATPTTNASSLRTVTPANSTFGFYFGSSTTKATATPTTNASSLRTVTPANSTFGFYFGSSTTKATATPTTNATATPTTNATATPTTNATATPTTNAIAHWSIIPSLYQVGKAVTNNLRDCSSGWYITGYFTPVEGDYSSPQKKIVDVQGRVS